ncbi:MAG: membrane-bound lytic murein transglycosylase MltF [Granulosicoccaceae bacterium]
MLLAVSLLTGCGEQPRLDRILENKKLVVVTRNAPTTHYEGRDGLAGFEYELVSAFARHLGVEVEFVIEDNLAEILTRVARGEVDMAAAGVTRTVQRQNGFLFSDPYQNVTQQVVCRRGGVRPTQPADLVGLSLAVPAGTSYVERLEKLQQTIPQLAWQTAHDHDTESFLEQVWDRQLDCTIGDSNIVALNRRYFPELSVRFAISEPEPLAWLLPKTAHGLQERANNWLAKFRASGELAQLRNKYYGFIDVFDYVDTRVFTRKVGRVLPRYRKKFEAAAQKYGLDWSLLAAQAYQESHWRPHARSPTGVRGIMMLTLATAKEVGIKSRLNVEQSIRGGARYLARLRDRLPDSIEEPDRTWIALAAYNVGMGHIYDARRLARQQGKDPDRWHDLKAVLPLLSQKQYYRKLKYGYARGREPVRYVQRIRDYHDMLLQALDAK